MDASASPCLCGAGWIPGKSDAKALWSLLTGSWLNLLLFVVPIGWIVHFCHLSAVLVFVLVRSTCPVLRCCLEFRVLGF